MSHPASLDIEAFIDRTPFSPFQWLLLLLCFLIIFMDGYDMAAIAYVAPLLTGEWALQKAELGPAMSAALFGLAFGSLLSGPLADRIGRKPAVIYSVLLFGIFSLATAWSSSVNSLSVLRFVTGLGLGAAMPNVITLLSEYCPGRQRTLLVSAMLCGFPLGAAVGGLLAGYLIPSFGWRSVLVVGGIVPILLCGILPWALPESVRYMVLKGYPGDRIRAILQRVKREGLEQVEHFVIAEKNTGGHSAIHAILTVPHRTITCLLWLSCFMSMLVFYMIVSWMPLLLKEAGLGVQQFSHISALFPLGGGVGSILIGWVMDRSEPNKTLAFAYLIVGILAYSIGLAVSNLNLLLILGSLVFLMGFVSGGGQSALASLAASYYPTSCRATGVGSMYGVGRFGAIAGVLAGAELLRYQYSASTIFSLLLIPAWLVCLALMLKNYSEQQRKIPETHSQD